MRPYKIRPNLMGLCFYKQAKKLSKASALTIIKAGNPCLHISQVSRMPVHISHFRLQLAQKKSVPSVSEKW